MTNFEFYKDEIKNSISNKLEDYTLAVSLCNSLLDCFYEHSIHNDAKNWETFIDWFYEEHKEPILTEEEKEYLNVVIKPFKDRINYIYKKEWDYEKEAICINYDGDDEVALPDFKKGVMYKGMKLDKEYTLKELGL